MARSNMFNLRSGHHRNLAILNLLGAATGFIIMLASLSTMQSVCQKELHLNTMNSVDPIIAFLTKIETIAATSPQTLATPQGQLLFLEGTLQSLATLTSRSVTGAFVLTPQSQCSKYYAYSWLATSMQGFFVIIAVMALCFDWLHTARVCICSLLTVSTVLAIENAHTYLYEGQFASGITLKAGKAFFFGCLCTSVANLLLVCILGFHDETTMDVAICSDNHEMMDNAHIKIPKEAANAV